MKSSRLTSQEFKDFTLLEWLTDQYRSHPGLAKIHELLKTDKDFADKMSHNCLDYYYAIMVGDLIGLDPNHLLKVQNETLPFFSKYCRQAITDYKSS